MVVLTHSFPNRCRCRFLAGASFLLVALLLPACKQQSGDQSAERSVAGNDAGPPRDANVVIYLIDTLRADYCHVYGYSRPTTPTMDALAASGVVFEQASAPAPWTLPTVVSLLLSQPVCEHNILIDRQKIPPQADPLAARLKRSGYVTGAFLCNPYAGPISGLDRGYDHCEAMKRQTNGRLVAPWLDRLGARRFFMYVHNTEPHNPYLAPRHYIDQFGTVPDNVIQRFKRLSLRYRALTRIDYALRQPLGTTDNTATQQEVIRELDKLRPQVEVLYAASVLQADTNLGKVIAALRQRGLWDNTLFIVLADHGEEMGERGMWQHDQSVNEELIHVPLIMRFPHDEYAGQRVSETVRLLDVMPTILDYLRRPELRHDLRGRSLMPVIRNAPDRQPVGMQVTSVRHNVKKYSAPNKMQRGDINVVVRDGMWKGIWNVEPDTFELYDLATDPAERLDRSRTDSPRATEMLDFARRWLQTCDAGRQGEHETAAEELDEATLDRLRTLGYVGEEAAEDQDMPDE